ncbi:hypothetical protein [Alteromonas sp. D210916BOD_24]|uniref:hypothetical protein n=1 Tax=Alteromonas sp. D210916BOD_24 TaxID=3157618 RepID=UPI00399C91AE
MANASEVATSTSNSESHSLYTALKRLFHTLVVSTVLALGVVLVLLFQQYQNDWLIVQTQFAGESIARQYAKLLQVTSDIPLDEVMQGQIDNNESRVKQNSHIERVVSVLMEEPHILALAVFDRDGRYIGPLPRTDSIVAMSQSQGVTPLSYVAAIENNDGDVLGYLNVHMDTQAMLESPLTLRYQLTFIAFILVFLALMMGIYLTRGFYKFRPWLLQAIDSKRPF